MAHRQLRREQRAKAALTGSRGKEAENKGTEQEGARGGNRKWNSRTGKGRGLEWYLRRLKG